MGLKDFWVAGIRLTWATWAGVVCPVWVRRVSASLEHLFVVWCCVVCGEAAFYFCKTKKLSGHCAYRSSLSPDRI